MPATICNNVSVFQCFNSYPTLNHIFWRLNYGNSHRRTNNFQVRWAFRTSSKITIIEWTLCVRNVFPPIDLHVIYWNVNKLCSKFHKVTYKKDVTGSVEWFAVWTKTFLFRLHQISPKNQMRELETKSAEQVWPNTRSLPLHFYDLTIKMRLLFIT